MNTYLVLITLQRYLLVPISEITCRLVLMEVQGTTHRCRRMGLDFTGLSYWTQVWTRACRRRSELPVWACICCQPCAGSAWPCRAGQSCGRRPRVSPAPPPPAPPWSRSTWCSQPGRSPPSPGLEIQSLQIKYPTFQHFTRKLYTWLPSNYRVKNHWKNQSELFHISYFRGGTILYNTIVKAKRVKMYFFINIFFYFLAYFSLEPFFLSLGRWWERLIMGALNIFIIARLCDT